MSVRAALLVIVCLLVAACGGGGTPAGSAASPTSGPAATPNSALLAELIGSGVALDDAAFLASTSFEVASTGPDNAKVVEHLISGDTVDFTVRIASAIGETPGLVSATSSTTADRLEVHLEYLVSTDGASEDILRSLDGIAAAGRRLAALGPLAAIRSADVSVVGVTVDWGISKVTSTLRDAAIRPMLEAAAPGQAGTLMKIVKAGFTAEKGAKLSDKLDSQLAELDKLAECAMNPTNPLTIKQYAEHLRIGTVSSRRSRMRETT